MLDSSMLVLGAANPLAGIVCLLFVGLPIGALIGAVILRAAVSMFNSLAGGDPVPEPAISKAFGMMILVAISNYAIRFLASLILAGPMGAEVPKYASSLAAFPFTFLICSAIFSSGLPTSFKRAMGVAVCHTVVLLLVLAVLFGIIFVVATVGKLGS
ncbi:hypothetical protein [Gimesia maris]|uniref:hypothetical protein n=1 Tax=Gimesia maris TaxID=122 RepID=UPI0032EF355C|tara:strand:- start:569 stop:1039 length:471 start_codon:yes stop_codon:yes gene_type:complete